MKRIKEIYVALLSAMLLSFVMAGVFQWMYSNSAHQEPDIHGFQAKLEKKVVKARMQLHDMRDSIIKGKPFFKLSKPDKDISYYIYRGDSLIFWTENELGVPVQYAALKQQTPFLELRHAYCVYQRLRHKDLIMVAVIKIKNNFDNPNHYLVNNFAQDFDLNPQVRIVKGSPEDKNAIFLPPNQYLFTLANNKDVPVYNNHLAILSIVCWVVGFLLLFVGIGASYLLRGQKRPSVAFLFASGLVSAVILTILVELNIPSIIFMSDLFSPIYYASGNVLPSLGHLIILTAFILGEVVFFFLHWDGSPFEVIRKRPKAAYGLFQGLSLLSFVAVCLLLKNLIYNSSFEITLIDLETISWLSIISITLIFCWLACFVLIRHKLLQVLNVERGSLKTPLLYNALISVGILVGALLLGLDWLLALWYFALCSVIDYFYLKRKNFFSVVNITLLVLGFTLFIVYFSVKHTHVKLANKYQIMATNLQASEMLNRNILAEILFEELNEDFFDDESLYEIANKKDSATIEMQNYLQRSYFRGFWNNYDIKFYLFGKERPTKADVEKLEFYNDLINKSAQIKKTNFYFCTDSKTKINYLGVFDLDKEILYIEFYPKLLTSSYSYPEPLLKSENKNNPGQMVSIANYEHGMLHDQRGKFAYPPNTKWIPRHTQKSFSFGYKGYIHFVYTGKGKNTVVVSRQQKESFYIYITYWAYLFVYYFFISIVVYSVVATINRRKRKSSFSFLYKLQLSFTLLLVISFLAIFMVSLNYIINQYKSRQSADIQNKTRYIQQDIDESFKNYSNLKQVNVVDLNFFLQDLSKIYQTDIHIYDNHGFLVGTSQPILFARGLSSSYISPLPFFEKRNNFTQTEKIGRLSYLSAYTRIYNGNNKPLGYMAVPAFLSADQMHKEIFNLVAVIINVYLIIIVVASLLSLFISNQLTKPIKSLEDKLNAINLKGKNERVEYKHNDEIGHLVEQYNKMVDKLEESALTLAKDERETAWKQMARQVTHEINNPLTPMKLTIQHLQRMQKMDQEAFNEYFKKSSQLLIEQIEHLSGIATAFSDFAKMPEAQIEPVNISDRLELVIELFRNNNENVDIAYTRHPDTLLVMADKEQLTQVFNNLLKNAIQSIPSLRKGHVSISTTNLNGKVCIEIKDNGTGIASEIQDKLFAPNFTTKTSGMGLGLAIVKNIVQANGGRIWFNTLPDVGTSFFVEFPLV